jgi:ATP-dependent Clp protease ATP-binding subunit ClpB
MDIEKFTERARGFLQAAQTIAIREYHQRADARAFAQGAAG